MPKNWKPEYIRQNYAVPELAQDLCWDWNESLGSNS